MRVAVRVDASPLIGGGHAMRCLALADELARRGASVTFVSAAMPDSLGKRIEAAGHELARIPAPAGFERAGEDWHEPPLDAAAQAADVRQTAAAADGADWCVVDHYLLDEHWNSAARGFAGRLLIIDDLANRRYDADLLVDETGDRTRADYDGLVGAETIVLAGAGYALLRPEFAQQRPAALARRREPKAPRRILISLGTMDPGGISAVALDAVLAAAPECAIDVVLGADAPSAGRILQIAGQRDGVSIHVDTDRMAELMRDADLAIGAAGTTSWERCCLGLPAIALVLADNQRANAEALARSGAAIAVDNASEIGPALANLLRDEQRLHEMSKAAFQLTDGLGTKRVADAMLDARAEVAAVRA